MKKLTALKIERIKSKDLETKIESLHIIIAGLKTRLETIRLEKARVKAIEAEREEARIQVLFDSDLPMGIQSIIGRIIYKIGAHGFFYRENVDEEGWTKCDVDRWVFCEGILD